MYKYPFWDKSLSNLNSKKNLVTDCICSINKSRIVIFLEKFPSLSYPG